MRLGRWARESPYWLDKHAFVPRLPQLLSLEGWYTTVGSELRPSYRFKFSCRFRDILRCSTFARTEHFRSCFAPDDYFHREQPPLRCYDATWAIIYTPDEHGDFMGRCFVQWSKVVQWSKDWQVEEYLRVDRVYGNRLSYNDIDNAMSVRGVRCLLSWGDTYL